MRKINCAICSVEIEITGSRQKYCDKCSKNIEIEKARERSRKWRENHKEEIREYNTEYQKSNRERIKTKKKEYHKEYYKTPHGRLKVNLNTQLYRARKKMVIHLFTKEEWENKLKQYNKTCPFCGEPESRCSELTLDHIYPSSIAYKDYIRELFNGNYRVFPRVYTIDDVEPMCSLCNPSKGNRIK